MELELRIKHYKDKPIRKLSLYFLYDYRLTLPEKGLFCVLLAKPFGYKLDIHKLSNELKADPVWLQKLIKGLWQKDYIDIHFLQGGERYGK